jgi:hypothetical protein
MAKPFCENRRGARCFAELFWTIIQETIYAVMISIHCIFLVLLGFLVEHQSRRAYLYLGF